MQLLFKIIDRLKRRFVSYYMNAPFRIPVASALGAIGFPLYYLVWLYLSPDSYENLTARIIGMLLCIGAAVSGYWKHGAPRFFYFYCYFTIIYVLPFFFSFMLFMDGFGYIWSLSAVASLLLFALLFDTLNLFVGTVLGVSCAYFLYYVKTGTFELPDQAFLAMPVMGFTLIMIRGVLAYNDHHVEKMKIHTAKALAGHIAHEMRTPLLGIQLDAKKSRKIVKREAEFRSQPLVLKSFDRILSHAVGANLVIDMLLTNARKTQAKKDSFLTFEAAEFVREILETYHFKSDEAERVSLVVDSGFYFRGTEVLMRHVIYNLLKNALKAIKEVSKGKIVIYISTDGKRGRIAVTDNGPGVPLAFQPVLFKPFSTTSQDDTGTGLGLAFCSMVIDDFEGKIQYSDASNGGAEFTIVVPTVGKEEV